MPIWRREWDSNPRWDFSTGLTARTFRPLKQPRHLCHSRFGASHQVARFSANYCRFPPLSFSSPNLKKKARLCEPGFLGDWSILRLILVPPVSPNHIWIIMHNSTDLIGQLCTPIMIQSKSHIYSFRDVFIAYICIIQQASAFVKRFQEKIQKNRVLT